MMRLGAKVKKVYLCPKPVGFRKSIDGLSALVELDIKAAVFDPVLFVFLNRARNRMTFPQSQHHRHDEIPYIKPPSERTQQAV